MTEPVRGYRVLGDVKKPNKQYNTDHLLQTPEAAKSLVRLRKLARTEGSNCRDRPDEFTPPEGTPLPSDTEAEILCAGCPLKTRQACGTYVRLGHPAFGVWDGKVRGRALEEAITEGGTK